MQIPSPNKGAWRQQAPPPYMRFAAAGIAAAAASHRAPPHRATGTVRARSRSMVSVGRAPRTARWARTAAPVPEGGGTAELLRRSPSLPAVTLGSPTGPCPGATCPCRPLPPDSPGSSGVPQAPQRVAEGGDPSGGVRCPTAADGRGQLPGRGEARAGHRGRGRSARRSSPPLQRAAPPGLPE